MILGMVVVGYGEEKRKEGTKTVTSSFFSQDNGHLLSAIRIRPKPHIKPSGIDAPIPIIPPLRIIDHNATHTVSIHSRSKTLQNTRQEKFLPISYFLIPFLFITMTMFFLCLRFMSTMGFDGRLGLIIIVGVPTIAISLMISKLLNKAYPKYHTVVTNQEVPCTTKVTNAISLPPRISGGTKTIETNTAVNGLPKGLRLPPRKPRNQGAKTNAPAAHPVNNSKPVKETTPNKKGDKEDK